MKRNEYLPHGWGYQYTFSCVGSGEFPQWSTTSRVVTLFSITGGGHMSHKNMLLFFRVEVMYVTQLATASQFHISPSLPSYK